MEPSIQQQVLSERKNRAINPFAMVLISTNLALLVMAVWAFVSFGSIRSAMGYYVRGETLLVDSNEKSFGTASPGDPIGVTFTLTNRDLRPVRVLGCQASCTCIVPENLPLTLLPNQKGGLTISIRTNAQSVKLGRSMVEQEVVLFTSSPAQPELHLTIKGRIHDSSK